MTLLRESYLYHLWTLLLAVYNDSLLHRVLAGIGSWCNRQIDGSRLLGVLCREGIVARAWPDSALCRLLTWIVNLPISLLHRLYSALQSVFEGSFFARLAFRSAALRSMWIL